MAGRSRLSAIYVAAAVLAAGALALAATSSPAVGQDQPDLRDRYLLPVPAADHADALRRAYWTVPAMGGSTPIAFGADWGVVWVGGSYQRRARYSPIDDAAAGAGVGLGNAGRLLGLQVGYISHSTFRSGWFSRSSIDLHLHRQLPHGFAVAVGAESAFHWGDPDDQGSSRYAVVSKWFNLHDDPGGVLSGLMLTAGVGDNRFQREDDFAAGRNRPSAFGSVAVRLIPQASLIADWTGQDLLLATSIAPLRNIGLVGTIGLADVVGTAGDGARLVIGGGLSHDFTRP